ncbi:MAG: undecaprenyldiphospho-muramoylpentapeptide beta-N-acetylglucosaminyltransferase [Saprospiraceae bacterium]
MKIIISGGGTGGHVFPAIAIADAIKELNPEAEILFVGAKGKLEMQAVPKAGYNIIGINIGGFQRRFTWRNVKLIYRLVLSIIKSNKIISEFKPELVLGVGGYASGPVLRVAAWKKIPIFIQEQNSYAGITNKLIAHKAEKIFVAFEGMQKFFKKSKIQLLGNPVRKDFLHTVSKEEGLRYFGLNPALKTIGVFGGSLGARTLNESINAKYNDISKLEGVQVLWQVGKIYYEEFQSHPISKLKHVKMLPFIDRMDLAYAICNVCITRAGAISLSELAVTRTVAVLVPSPNVAENHQRKNAESLLKENAALMVLDVEARKSLWSKCIELLNNENKCIEIKNNLERIAKPLAAQMIAEQLVNFVKK